MQQFEIAHYAKHPVGRWREPNFIIRPVRSVMARSSRQAARILDPLPVPAYLWELTTQKFIASNQPMREFDGHMEDELQDSTGETYSSLMKSRQQSVPSKLDQR